ncbi:hypothetical protein [Roseovarius sp. SYSU LYC5161]|nr:hypothetical protein [Roseovarius sp.]
MIAVGSSPLQLPGWPEENRIWGSAAALERREIPQRLAVVDGASQALKW